MSLGFAQQITMLTSDTSIHLGDSVQLVAQTDGIIVGWTPSESLTDPHSHSPWAKPTETTTYTVRAGIYEVQQNLITNGDFEQGFVGFTSEYGGPVNGYATPGQFGVGPLSYRANARFFMNVGDHTTGSGNMLYADGGPTYGVKVYQTQVTVVKGQTYAFSAWVNNLHATYSSPAQMRFIIDGDTLGKLEAPTEGVIKMESIAEWNSRYNSTHGNLNPAGRFVSSGGKPRDDLSYPSNEDWLQFYSVWVAPVSGPVEISIINVNTYPSGNDFAIDDLVFAPVTLVTDSVGNGTGDSTSALGSFATAKVTITIKENGAKITHAEMFPNLGGGPDSVYLTFAGPMAQNLSELGSFKLNGVNITAESMRAISPTKWLVMFPEGSVFVEDRIRAIGPTPTDGWRDMDGNPPPANGEPVIIQEKESTLIPTWVSGYVQDFDSDGISDGITVEIWPGPRGNADQADDVISFQYSGSDTIQFIAVEKSVMSFSENIIHLDVPAIAIDSGWAKLTFPNGLVQGQLLDNVGPKVIKAEMAINKGSDFEKVYLTFSEPLKENLPEAGAVDVNGILMGVSSAQAISSVIWEISLPVGTADIGDSIRAMGPMPSDGWRDLTGNAPAANAAYVLIEKMPSRIDLDALFASKGNEFQDINWDGSMDRITLAFNFPLTTENLDVLNFEFTWIDSLGSILTLRPLAEEWVLAKDGLSMIWDVPEHYTVHSHTTGFGGGKWGKAVVTQVAIGNAPEEHKDISMDDVMPPVIANAYLSMSTNPNKEPDILYVDISEAVDYKSLATEIPFEFYMHRLKNVQRIDLSYSVWSEDGDKVQIYLYSQKPLDGIPLPGDSIHIVPMEGGIADLVGNTVRDENPWTVIKGSLRTIIESNDIATLKDNEVETMPSFEAPRFFDWRELTDNITENRIGPVIVPSVDTNLTMSEISWNYSVWYYTSMGEYVAHTQGILYCDDPGFQNAMGLGTCLDNPNRKIFIEWNMRSNSGRKVGAGAYIQKVNFQGIKDTKMIGVMR